jgi:colicin import membrane protein
MSDDPDKRGSEARGAELRENIALTDARRAEEEQAKAEKEAEEATKEAEKAKAQAARDREKAERLHAEAERERLEAPRRDYVEPEHTTPEAAVAGLPGVDKLPPAAQRPEVLIGAAFAGSFIVAQILKRIFD